MMQTQIKQIWVTQEITMAQVDLTIQLISNTFDLQKRVMQLKADT